MRPLLILQWSLEFNTRDEDLCPAWTVLSWYITSPIRNHWHWIFLVNFCLLSYWNLANIGSQFQITIVIIQQMCKGNAWLSCIIIWYQSVLAHIQTYCYIILFTVFSSFRPKEAYVKFQRSNHRSAPYVRKFLIADFWNYTIVFKLFPQPLFLQD